MTVYYPYTHLFHGPSHTVAISGPHIQVINTTYASLLRVSFAHHQFTWGRRTGDVLQSTALFTDEARSAVFRSGPVRCAAVDKELKYLITTGEDKILKLWEVDGLKLLSERYAIHVFFFFSTRNGLTVNCPRSQQALLLVQMRRVFWRLTSLVIYFSAFPRFSWDVAGFTTLL